MKSDIRISCIIVTYNSEKSIKNCISSIQSSPIQSEIIVVDNNSYDNTKELLRGKNINTVFLENNVGFGRGVNIGVEKSETEFLFILNPDTEILPDTFSELLNFADSNKNWSVLAPRLNYPDGKLQISAREFPDRLDFLAGRGSPLFKLGLTDEKKAGYIIPENDNPLEVPAVAATAILMKTDFFNQIGGFDEMFFMYLEDIDLCRRVRDKGENIFMIPTAVVKHIWRESSKSRPFFTSYHHHRSVYKYFRKYYPNQIIKNMALLLALSGGFIVSSLLILFKPKGAK